VGRRAVLYLLARPPHVGSVRDVKRQGPAVREALGDAGDFNQALICGCGDVDGARDRRHRVLRRLTPPEGGCDFCKVCIV